MNGFELRDEGALSYGELAALREEQEEERRAKEAVAKALTDVDVAGC